MGDQNSAWPVRASAVLAMCALAVTAAACSSFTSAPPGPAQPSVSAAPSATVPPNAGGVHAGGVSEDTYRAVLSAIKADGISVADESGVRMTYGVDQQHVVATGGGMTKSGKPVTEVDLQQTQGTWHVVVVR